jgi:hypothetical protein
LRLLKDSKSLQHKLNKTFDRLKADMFLLHKLPLYRSYSSFPLDMRYSYSRKLQKLQMLDHQYKL